MSKIYTEDLLRFIYNETTTEESNAISLALASQHSLRAEFDQLKETIDQLDSASMLPHPTSIEIIMEESLKHAVEVAHS